ncbi:MAG: hypothetical protein SPH63_04895 [Candidatus Cryptobacteroides sp.]|nr:hypothetical protein [Bacteroides sp.]MCI7663254.1 hypothetical protein [Bacteroides sp.]MDD6623421.1 hypothetical protein [Bacteroides sp.]MDY5302343.1 hypothetical protein [Candidatus Cryptobacteroides sp.]MDY5407861.1 hypothetical protein [Candidatus Cryptobacteroides sp.]
MDLFDILWLVVCLGLPVISGIAASAEKKKKAQGRPVVTQEPEGNDLPSWMEILTGQPMEAESVDEVPEEQTVVEEVVPAAGKTLETKPTVAVPAKNHCSDAIADGAIGGAEPEKRIDKERIDPEKLVVYTAIMNPKFNEY